ncbi:hypothetical protein OS493_033957 [Desmophyllum pertusum]|uniref:Uncharacterized protein n=1 Tax=Desmophyllum pertusum TaxID=174260 RepID=A0A9W9ZJP7_9CNID|nr:hypothetical protein OS493_033957 [Desmophyllum pertusum]
MAAQWKNFKTQMKEKRAGKRRAPSHDILQKEVIIIQRLSAEVSGKAQKANPRPKSCARTFIEANDRDVASVVGNRVEREEQPKRPFRRAIAQSLPATKAQSPSKAFPKSLSVLEMMKLGKVINDKSTESIELFTFDPDRHGVVQPTFDGGIQHCQRAFWKRRVSRSV